MDKPDKKQPSTKKNSLVPSKLTSKNEDGNVTPKRIDDNNIGHNVIEFTNLGKEVEVFLNTLASRWSITLEKLIQKILFYSIEHKEEFDVEADIIEFEKSSEIYKIDLILSRNKSALEKWCMIRKDTKEIDNQILYVLYRFYNLKMEFKKINEYVNTNRQKFHGAKS